MNKIATKTFTADLKMEGTWGEYSIGTHTSTMDLYMDDTKTRGCIEWDISHIEECLDIGLTFEERDGLRYLTDYDGTMSLPKEAVKMLNAAGIEVEKEFL
jgi:hypothetical protein